MVGQSAAAGGSKSGVALPGTKSGVFPGFLTGKPEKRLATPRPDLYRHSAASVGYGAYLLVSITVAAPYIGPL